jgi:hypothetical protein
MTNLQIKTIIIIWIGVTTSTMVKREMMTQSLPAEEEG